MPLSPLSGALLASGGLTDIDATLFYSTLALFAIFAFILAKFAWKPLLQIIEEREKGVREAIDGAREANAEAQALLEKHKEMVREAGREREEILKKALQEADALKTDLQNRARVESDQIIARAKEQVEREKTAAIQELRSQVADLAIEAASKIVISSLSAEAQRKLVNDFIASVPKAQ
ncbi:MAG: F0F1 ATP synthase subunit B [Vicinamibacteria bacterium]